MRALIVAVVLAVAATACGGAAATSEADFVVGGLYWAPADGGGYSVFKLVARDDEGVHLMVYSNIYAEPPSAVDESQLYLAERERNVSPGDQLGLDHVQVGWEWITTWDLGLIQMSTVRDEELDGYRRWLIETSPAFN